MGGGFIEEGLPLSDESDRSDESGKSISAPDRVPFS